MRRWLGIVVGASLAACGDGAATPDAAPVPDAAIDASPCDLPARGQLGGPCEDHEDCDGECYDEPRHPEVGYCAAGTCMEDADCGPDGVCAIVDKKQYRECLLACRDEAVCDSPCPTGMVCSPTFIGYGLRGKTACVYGNNDATDGSPCTSTGDCHDGDWCWRDPLQAPGGVCMTWGCNSSDDSTCAPGGDGHCFSGFYFGTTQIFGTDYCLDTCVVDADCRQAEGYRCYDGTALGAGHFCRATWVGDPCAVDADCGPAPWRCDTAGYPGGYCTTACNPDALPSCPTDSACDDTTTPTTCLRRCSPAGNECRAGYACELVGGLRACVPAT